MVYKLFMDSDAIKRRMHAIFCGRVQGVGFRYTVCHLAGSFDVTGYVRNLRDGNVELIAEGNEQVLVDFLRSIRRSLLCRYIVRDSVAWEPATGEYDSFGISY